MPAYDNIRVAKVAAIISHKPTVGENSREHFALLDGGHKVPITEETAKELSGILNIANTSDAAFFGRGG